MVRFKRERTRGISRQRATMEYGINLDSHGENGMRRLYFNFPTPRVHATVKSSIRQLTSEFTSPGCEIWHRDSSFRAHGEGGQTSDLADMMGAPSDYSEIWRRFIAYTLASRWPSARRWPVAVDLSVNAPN